MLNIFHPTGGGGVGDTIFGRVPLPDFILICHLNFNNLNIPQGRAGEALVTAALQKASQQCGLSLEQLQSLPLGSQRRGRHDDTTALVMYL